MKLLPNFVSPPPPGAIALSFNPARCEVGSRMQTAAQQVDECSRIPYAYVSGHVGVVCSRCRKRKTGSEEAGLDGMDRVTGIGPHGARSRTERSIRMHGGLLLQRPGQAVNSGVFVPASLLSSSVCSRGWGGLTDCERAVQWWRKLGFCAIQFRAVAPLSRLLFWVSCSKEFWGQTSRPS